MDRLVLAFLGGFRARLESGPSVLVPTKKGQALLAYLACSPTVSHPRDALATLFWGDTAQQHARHSLRQTLFMLRAAFPASVSAILRGDAETISLDATSLVVDVLDFERLAGDSALEALHAASTLYRGDLLVGIPVDDRGFEEWLRAKREQLRELAVEVFTKLLTLQCAAGLTERAIQTALRLLALDPLQEAVHRELMRLYASMARPGAAVRQYRTCAQTLKRELGLEPKPETTKLLHELVPHPRQPSRSLPATASGTTSALTAEQALFPRAQSPGRVHVRNRLSKADLIPRRIAPIERIR